MSTIQNLIKAHKAQTVVKDDYTLEKYLAKKEENGVAILHMKAIETKYIPKYDNQATGGSLGMRTRFIQTDGTTIGTFSNAAYQFFAFFANLMKHDTSHINYLHIDIDGELVVKVSEIALDQTRSTYNFEIVEEGSNLRGFADYLPSVDNIIALDAQQAPAADPAPETASKSK